MIRWGSQDGDARKRGTAPLMLSAVIGDYDGGIVTVAEAVEKLRDAEIAAFVYTTASHRPEAPRWRVVAFVGAAIAPARYGDLVDLLNGALGGILARESWEASRCYYYGAVRGVQYVVEEVQGLPLDLHDAFGGGWEPIGKPVAGTQAKTAAPRGQVAPNDDDERQLVIDSCADETMDELEDALLHVPADDRGTWIDVGNALASLKGTTHEDRAHSAWLTWSQSSKAFQDGDESKWNEFTPTEITYRTVFELAQRNGWKNPRKAELETERERSMRIAREGSHITPTQRILSGSEILENFVYIANGARVASLAEPRFTLPFGEFKSFTAGSVEVTKPNGPKGRPKKTLRADLWLANPERKTVRTQTFAPGKAAVCTSPDGDESLNLWVPRAGRAPDNWQELYRTFVNHVEYLVPLAVERERFLDWLAHIEQRPGELPHTHYLLVAKQTGIGRNWLAYALARVFAGYVALGFDLGEALRSGFNGALSQRLIAVVDELHEGGPGGANKPMAEKLKSMLTEQTRRVNPKYGRQHTEFNCCRFLMFSNHEAALPLAENDRRVIVIENPSQQRSPDYYALLYRMLDEPGLGAAIAEGLKRRDITQFNPGERAPMNAAKTRTIRAGRSEVEQAVRDLAADWPSDCITSACLQASVSNALGGKVGSTAAACVAAGLIKHDGRVRVAGVNSHVWILRNRDTWSSAVPAAIAAEVLRGDQSDFA